MNNLNKQPNDKLLKKQSIKYLFTGIAIVLTILIVSLIYYFQKELLYKEDVEIVATLKDNDVDSDDYYAYKEYRLEVEISKSKDGIITMFPIIEGVGRASYGKEDTDEYFVPTNIGSTGFVNLIVLDVIEKEKLLENADKNIFLRGLWIPKEAGEFKIRPFMSKLEDFKEVKNPVLICVYHEEIFGIDFSWSKIIPIKYEK